METIGFAGTAKNTGKTTALTAVAAEAARTGLRLALTSIGMDGEAKDNVTGLPKPRVHVPAGALVATAIPFEAGPSPAGVLATLELLSVTPFRSPLGPVAIYRVLHAGLTVLAGPLVKSELDLVLDSLRAGGADLALVDGAVNRLAPLAAVDQMVLSTGAARHESAQVILDEAQALAFLFDLPAVADGGEGAGGDPAGGQPGGGIPAAPLPQVNWPGPAVLTDETAAADLAAFLTAAPPPVSRRSPFRLVFPSLVATKALRALVTRLIESHVVPGELVFPSAATLVVAGPAPDTAAALLRLNAAGWQVLLSSAVRLAAITVSPYRPVYDRRGRFYTAGRMADGEYSALVDALGRRIRCPVIDVVRAGPTGLFKRLTQV